MRSVHGGQITDATEVDAQRRNGVRSERAHGGKDAAIPAEDDDEVGASITTAGR